MKLGIANFTDRVYARMLIGMFPGGPAFPRNKNDSLFSLLMGLSQELARLDGRWAILFKESEPGNAEEMIAEHEIDHGFPDAVFEIPANLAARQKQCEDRAIFPINIPTGFTCFCNVTAGSDIIQIGGDTSALFIGDALQFAAGFEGGKYRVVDKVTSNTWRMEQVAKRTAYDILATAYFMRSEFSERFFKAIADYLGEEITEFEYYGQFEMGVDASGWSQTGDVGAASNRISNIASTSGILVNQFVVVEKGMGLFPVKVIAKGSTYIDVSEFAGGTFAGVTLTGYALQPFGMGDAIGDAYRFTVIIRGTFDETAQAAKYILTLMPANSHAIFIEN